MIRWMLGSVAALALASATPWGQDTLPHAAPRFAVEAPASWLPDDPADSLYRAGREALNRRQYRKAAELFAQVSSKYPRSGYAGDALYWEAFALYRADDLRTSLARLDDQKRRYPSAATAGDAAALATRVRGELARRGDAGMAADLVGEAEDIAATSPGESRGGRAGSRNGLTTTRGSADMAHGDRCDEDSDVKVMALNAVMQMDADRAMPLLTRVLAKRDAASACLRRKAVFLVAQQRTDSTATILMRAVRDDPDPEVREQAVFWLSQVPGPRTVALLDSLVRFSSDEAIQDKAVFALSQEGSDQAQAALRALAERNDAPREARERAIFWLGQSRNGGPAYLRQLYPKLADEGLKERLIFGIAQSNEAADRQWLLDLVRNGSEDVELRKRALFWVAQSADLAQLDALYKSLTDGELKEQIIFGYAQRKDPAAVDRLITIAKTDKDPELRKKALFWLGQSRDPRAVDVLEQFLNE